MSEEKKYVVDPPKPKPSKLRRAVEEIKSGVKKVGQEYKAGNIPLTVPSMVKKIKNKYRKTQISKPKFSNVQVPVGKPKKTRDVQKLKDSVIKAVKSQDQTTTYKRAVPGKPGSQVYLVPPKGKK